MVWKMKHVSTSIQITSAFVPSRGITPKRAGWDGSHLNGNRDPAMAPGRSRTMGKSMKTTFVAVTWKSCIITEVESSITSLRVSTPFASAR
jgi:hypothetical protein